MHDHHYSPPKEDDEDNNVAVDVTFDNRRVKLSVTCPTVMAGNVLQRLQQFLSASPGNRADSLELVGTVGEQQKREQPPC